MPHLAKMLRSLVLASVASQIAAYRRVGSRPQPIRAEAPAPAALVEEVGIQPREEASSVILHKAKKLAVSEDTWIVTFMRGVTDALINTFCAEARCKMQGHPDERGLGMAVVRADAATMKKLKFKYKEQIHQVEADSEFDMALVSIDSEHEEMQRNSASWGLDRVDQVKWPLSGSYTSPGNQGAGVHIFILDTGVRSTHHDFGGRALPFYDVYREDQMLCDESDQSCAGDVNSHGTHCAGTAGGTGFGVAPKSQLHAVKVLADNGAGWASFIIAGMDAVMMTTYRPAVMSMSLNGGVAGGVYIDAVERASEAGIIVVVAAGNANTDACTTAPAYVPKVITVGSTNSLDGMSVFSNFGPCVDIFAPGSKVKSASASSDTSSVSMSGTSQAAPHVAGAAAVRLSDAPNSTVDDVSGFLMATGTEGVISLLPGEPASPNKLLLVASDLPAPTPSPAWGTFELRGPCVREGNCVSSGNYPESYEKNEACGMTVHASMNMEMQSFETELYRDKLVVNGIQYSGSSDRAPPNPLVTGEIQWLSDASLNKAGWKFCLEPSGITPAPTPAPTPVPTPAPVSEPPFSLTGDGCTVVAGENCVTSLNFPLKYGADQSCTMAFNGEVDLSVETFQTEQGWDFLTLNGVEYSGSAGPPAGLTTGELVWSADEAFHSTGWKICANFPAPPPEITFEVVGDGCVVTAGSCVTSTNYPLKYGADQTCTIAFEEPTEIAVESFDTEEGYDFLTVNGVQYSGHDAPPGGLTTGELVWSSDDVFNANGWKICMGGAEPEPISQFFAMEGNGCTSTGDCVTSGNYPLKYGPNENCTITVNGTASLVVEKFDTEQGWDFLTVNGVAFSGVSGPAAGPISGEIHWASDSVFHDAGWKLCFSA